MKILHINSNYIYTQLHQTMIEHFCEDVSNTVIVPTYDKDKGVINPNSNVIIQECFKKQDRFLFDYKQKKIISAIERAVNICEYDCIHAYTLFTDGNAAMQIAKKYKKPFIVAIRNTDVNDFFKYRIWLRKRGIEIMKDSDQIVFLSPTYKERVINHFVPEKDKDIIRAKSVVIPNGIDDFWLNNKTKKNYDSIRAKIKENRIDCIFVGAHDKNKNTENILKAISILNSEGWNITLYSAGKIVDKRLFKQLKCYKCFNYIGVLKKEELIKHYQDSDIFIMVSHTETFGLVYAEAMSQGLPVIYTRGQGFDGQFNEGKVGYHVNDTDPKDIAEKIELVCKRYQDISENCFLNGSKFSWDTIVEKYRKIYENILASNS